MKISKPTFEVLKNFAQINNSYSITEPKVLKTLSVAENIIGVYDCEEEFPVPISLYNSVPFISMVQMLGLDNVEFEFDGKRVLLTSKSTNFRGCLWYTDPDMLPKLGNLKDSSVYKKFTEFDASFELNSTQIDILGKTASILNVPDMTVKIADGKGMITIRDAEGAQSDTGKMAIQGEGTAEVVVMVKNLCAVDGVYTVKITNNRMLKFDHNDMPLFYILAAKQV